MIDPGDYERSGDLDTGIVRIVAGDGVAIVFAVAAVSVPRINRILRVVFTHLEGAIIRMALQAALGRPAGERNGQKRLGSSAAILLHKPVRGRAIGQ